MILSVKNNKNVKANILKLNELEDRIKLILDKYARHHIEFNTAVTKDTELKSLMQQRNKLRAKIENSIAKSSYCFSKDHAFGKSMRLIHSNERKKPIIKINNKPVVLGTVVKLKSSDIVDYDYSKELKYLVDTGHRFVVGIYFGPKYNTVSIHLLSTSEYVNEYNQAGALLMGDYSKYGNGKQVYIDMQKIWVIKKNYIKTIEYELNKDDKLGIEESVFSTFCNEPKFMSGIIGSGVVDREFELYNNLNHMHYRYQDEIEHTRNEMRQFYHENYNYTKIEEILLTTDSSNNIYWDSFREIKNIVDADSNNKTIYDKNKAVQEIFNNLVNNLPDDEVQKQANRRRRGYDYNLGGNC